MGDVVEIDLPKEETRTEVLDRLERADPADPTKNLEGVIRQPGSSRWSVGRCEFPRLIR